MSGWNVLKKRRASTILVLDAIVFGVVYYYIPEMVRPLDGVLITAFGLGLITVLWLRNGLLRNVAMTVAVVAAVLFGLEMAEKKFDLTGMLDEPAQPQARKDYGPAKYAWKMGSAASYLDAVARYRADGGDPDVLSMNFAGDVFKGTPSTDLSVRMKRQGGKEEAWIGRKPANIPGPPLGYELSPDNLLRHYVKDAKSGEMALDISWTTGGDGLRKTRCLNQDGDVYLFLGCSVTFGFGLNDDETIPHFFAAEKEFQDRVLNFGVSGYGPHQTLRDLELNRHSGKADFDLARVKAVVYTLINDHARRADNPSVPGEPKYALENGALTFIGEVGDSVLGGRVDLVLERGRIYPKLRSKFAEKANALKGEYRLELLYVLLGRIDQLCRERYGVGLTVLYCDDDEMLAKEVARHVDAVVMADSAMPEEWRSEPIKYYVYDGHYSANTNRFLAQGLRAHFAEK